MDGMETMDGRKEGKDRNANGIMEWCRQTRRFAEYQKSWLKLAPTEYTKVIISPDKTALISPSPASNCVAYRGTDRAHIPTPLGAGCSLRLKMSELLRS